MKKQSLKLMIIIIPILFLLSGCGVRKKQLLSKISMGMHKEDVKLKIGKPDNIRCPFINKKNEVVDIWEYSLATVDANKEEKQLLVSIFGGIFFWPLLLAIPFMESPYDYEIYCLEFVNDFLFRWGRSSEIVQKNIIYDHCKE